VTAKKSASKKPNPNKFYLWFFVLLLGYVLGTIFAPIKGNTYHLSNLAIHLLQLTLVIPIATTWFLAVFAGVRFKRYANKIGDYPDGEAINWLANGLLTLGFVSLATSLFSVFVNYQEPNTMVYRNLRIESNILGVLAIAAVFLLIYRGSRRLLKLIDRPDSETDVRTRLIATILTVILTASYAASLFTDAYRSSTPDALKHTSFYMSDAWLFFVILIPTVIVWAIGSQAMANLIVYQANVKGTTYRQVFKQLSVGLTLVLSIYILMTILTTISQFLIGASLKSVLIFLYIFIIVYASGFIIIARGANNLSKIEEV